MTQELRKAMTRIRKAQDAIINGKVRHEDNHKIILNVSYDTRGTIDITASFFVDKELTRQVCYLIMGDASSIVPVGATKLEHYPMLEEVMIELSNFIGYPV